MRVLWQKEGKTEPNAEVAMAEFCHSNISTTQNCCNKILKKSDIKGSGDQKPYHVSFIEITLAAPPLPLCLLTAPPSPPRPTFPFFYTEPPSPRPHLHSTPSTPPISRLGSLPPVGSHGSRGLSLHFVLFKKWCAPSKLLTRK